VSHSIPIVPLQKVVNLQDLSQSIFFAQAGDNTVNAPLNSPYRSDYYGVGLTTEGTSVLKTDLTTYDIAPNSIAAIAPHVIKQWVMRSADYKSYTVFFKKELLLQFNKQQNFLNEFTFFNSNEQHVLHATNEQAQHVQNNLLLLHDFLNGLHPYKTELIAHQLCIVLYTLQDYFQQINFIRNANITRSQMLATDFKNLVSKYFRQEHGVKFYAQQLHVSAKHLSETIKQETSKTAGEWIDENILLEAKVLLSDNNVTISQVADMLNFTDQSSFGKFFKNLSGQSPKEYKLSL
jgi:AraC family transcriptional regulator, transcriptional activator of pobA